MTSLRILALLVVILSAVIFLQTEGILKDSQKEESKSKRFTAKPFSSANPSPSLEPTEQLAVTAELKVSEKEEMPNSTISDYRYPGAKVTVTSDSAMTLESIDDAAVITNWYEDKIREKGLGTKTFVKTNTNGEVNNKLVGASGIIEISVQIVKSPATNVTITVAQN